MIFLNVWFYKNTKQAIWLLENMNIVQESFYCTLLMTTCESKMILCKRKKANFLLVSLIALLAVCLLPSHSQHNFLEPLPNCFPCPFFILFNTTWHFPSSHLWEKYKITQAAESNIENKLGLRGERGYELFFHEDQILHACYLYFLSFLNQLYSQS